eukprot:TRINITY_DN1855_c0_g1_i1.p1 TRINITY_DN1855_c0_g1~~TRINITY_DN1855_c0_g1_i1.p1  ORF type:complete len:394 (+),score=41.22 TRINITY_DN1855_c0_g1_i1:91-1272(+)
MDSSTEVLEFDADMNAFVISAITAWREAVADHAYSLECNELTCGGGNKTVKFTLSLENDAVLRPSAVVLHVRDGSTRPREIPFRFPRMAAAQGVWAAAGLAPDRLAQGKNWYIDAFDGIPAAPSNDSDFLALGEMLAKLHSTSVAWFEPIRKQLVQDHPALQSLPVPHDSHVWYLLTRSEWLLRKPFSMDEQYAEYDDRQKLQSIWPLNVVKSFCDGGAVAPTHPLMKRVVPFHGDMHVGNAIKSSDGTYKVIDFEFVGVGAAVIDMSMILGTCGDGLTQSKQHLIRGYFSSLGLEAPTDQDVREILIDVALHAFTTHDDIGYLDVAASASSSALTHPDSGILSLQQSFATSIRSSPELQDRILKGEHIYYDVWMQSPEYDAFARVSAAAKEV